MRGEGRRKREVADLDNQGFVRYSCDMPKFPKVNTSALDVGNYILTLAESEGASLDPITLQKVLYYCQCWSLNDGERLFDDPVEAWVRGPVVRCVWKAYSGSSPVPRSDERRFFELSADQMELVQSVWESLKGVHGFTLADRTHEPGTAWFKARGGLPDTAHSDRELSLDDMARDAAQAQQEAERRLTESWDDVVGCEK
jgi:uncharacterized phage-associated protein